MDPHLIKKHTQTNKTGVGFVITNTQIDDIQISFLSKNVYYSDQYVTS